MKMKKTLNFSLCLILICGLVISTTTAQEIQGIQEVTQEKESSEIKELTIRNSGFRSRSTVVIKYRDEDKQIVAVTENGKELPSSEFPRYESVMRIVLELPQIDRLLPEIDRAYRRAESPRISVESKLREMLALKRSLTGLDSDVARRYQDFTEFQLLATLNNLTAKISKSDDLSQEEKIAQLKDVIKRIQATESAIKARERRRELQEFRATNAVRSLIEEINKSSELSKKEKIKEIKDILQQMQETDKTSDRRRGVLIEIEAGEALSKMLQEVAKKKDLSDQEKAKEFESLIQEIEKINSEDIKRMVGIEKFKFDLNLFLKQEGLLPDEKAEFVLNSKACSIDGKRLPKEIHKEILQLCEECIGKKFGSTTKIVLQLNEDR